MGETTRHLTDRGETELPRIRLVDPDTVTRGPVVQDVLEGAGDGDPYVTLVELIACAEREDSATDEFLRRRYSRRKEALFERLLL